MTTAKTQTRSESKAKAIEAETKSTQTKMNELVQFTPRDQDSRLLLTEFKNQVADLQIGAAVQVFSGYRPDFDGTYHVLLATDFYDEGRALSLINPTSSIMISCHNHGVVFAFQKFCNPFMESRITEPDFPPHEIVSIKAHL